MGFPKLPSLYMCVFDDDTVFPGRETSDLNPVSIEAVGQG